MHSAYLAWLVDIWVAMSGLSLRPPLFRPTLSRDRFELHIPSRTQPPGTLRTQFIVKGCILADTPP